MSGGFFRGTSADQDTRFSNKQAKLLKSQKFHPELEHLVDMTKVSMDVIKPWIANRVTELLGFEDEVLINFIYGLLDGKEVNGKQIQISLTGFMEKNTGKFMKELWTLLLSAQNNVSGVPQQFLDAKQEEARKKKEESDRIANEIQKKKDQEFRELEEERLKKRDGGVDIKSTNAALDTNSTHKSERAPSDRREGERGADNRNGVRARNRVSRSPPPGGRALSRGSPTRSNSKSLSRSRSRSNERHRSKSMSRSPPRRRSISPRRRHSPVGSVSPGRGRALKSRKSRSPSPPRRRVVSRRSPSPAGRRSPSPRRRRSPSPARRRRSPFSARRRRSPSPPPRRRRSPTPPRRRRSPSPPRRRRSPSPIRRRRSPSPARRRRSPSPQLRRRSPSPYRRRVSPVRRRQSPSPVRRRVSPSPVGRRGSPSPSPVRRRMSPSPVRRRSPSLKQQRRSQRSPSTPRRDNSLPARQRSPVAGGDGIRLSPGSQSPPPLDRSSLSPVRSSPTLVRRKSPMLQKRSPVPSPDERIRTHEKGSAVVHRSSRSPSPGSPSGGGGTTLRRSPNRPSSRQPRDQMIRKEISSPITKSSEQKLHRNEINEEKQERRGVPDPTERRRSPKVNRDFLPSNRQEALYSGDGRKSEDKGRSRSNNTKDSTRQHKVDSSHISAEKAKNRDDTSDSGSEERDKHKAVDKDNRKHKRSERHDSGSDDDDSYNSDKEDRKEAKRRKKEEKRLRKEKRRQKREDRRRRREERRSEKLKGKTYSDDSASDGEHGKRRDFHSSDNEETEAEKQKRLEIELRNKALESLKAKKGISR